MLVCDIWTTTTATVIGEQTILRVARENLRIIPIYASPRGRNNIRVDT